MTDQMNTPFIRYRHGIELLIDPNIIESIKTFIDRYKTVGDVAFRELISQIGDGNGAGISQKSTWFKAIQELFDRLRDYDPGVQEQVKNKYIDFLQILSSDGSSEEIWCKLKELFEKNVDILSLWEFHHVKKMLEETKPFKDKDGKVIEQSKFGVVEVLNGETLSEARYGYIAEDTCSKYGSIGLLLRLTQLVFIEKSLSVKADDYTHIKFILNDDGFSTWYLQGYWQIKSVKQERYIKWHPKDFYTDILWLESDLVALVGNVVDIQEQENKSIDPRAPIKKQESDTTLFKKSIQGYSHQYEVALDTNVFISAEDSSLPDEVYFEFQSRLIRWINGSVYRLPVLIIPTNDESYEEAAVLARKFISMLIFENSHISIREGANIGRPVGYYPAMINQPRLPSITSINSRFINHSGVGVNEKEWGALSLYKEAKNSTSIFYEMYNYYKLIQLSFLKSDGSEDKDACISWINSEISSMSSTQEKTDLLESVDEFNTEKSLTFTCGDYINHLFRDSIAHVGKLTGRDRVNGVPTIVPDDIEDGRRFRKVILLVEHLAKKTIEQGMHR